MSDNHRYQTLDANEAVAKVAYRLSGEHADAWSEDRHANLWGAVPDVVEMQSEGGAAGNRYHLPAKGEDGKMINWR